MNFSIKQIPYSRYGTYYTFYEQNKNYVEKPGLYFRTVHGDVERDIFRLEVLEGTETVCFDTEAAPGSLKLLADNGSIEICICNSDVILIRGKNAGIRFIKENTQDYDYMMPELGGLWQFNGCSHNVKLMFVPVTGTISVDAVWVEKNNEKIVIDIKPDPDTCKFEHRIKEFRTSWSSRNETYDFDTCVRNNLEEFERFLDKTLPVSQKYAKARETAAYINWTSFVHPWGHIRRDSMLMSKNYMTNIWSWDHCFNAMALRMDISRSYDQILSIFDHQDEFGAIPDSINDNSRVINFCKPPIHGWALNWIWKRNGGFPSEYLAEIYGPLCRWTDWWFKFRDEDRDGLPQYNHGNDSGWDNGTIFAEGVPVESPDLSAFLVLQMDLLAKAAAELGKVEEAETWKSRTDVLMKKMMEELWDGREFFSRHAYTHKRIVCESLQNYLPVVLGNRLSKEVFSKLVQAISKKGRFLTEHGLATESLQSSEYIPDGYWRGPIWAPTTMLFADGLARGGEQKLAADIARKFCNNCSKNGMAENFDAITGNGLRDKAYTWSSSVFLMLASEYLK